MIDGEAVLLGVDGVSDFRGLHSGKYNAERCSSTPSTYWRARATTCAGCRCPMRKANLARLLRGRSEGIFMQHS
ncbi:hypothetical protein ACVWZR_000351 [Bradyrhizobium sp. i1.3.1]